MDSLSSQASDARGDAQETRPQTQRQGDLGGLLWRTVLHPSALIVTATVLLLLIVATALLPQLPDQLRDEPAAAARWLMTTATDFGSIGTPLRGAGLFSVFDSLLFRLALALLTAIISAHFIDGIGNVLSLRQLRQNLCSLSAPEIGRKLVAISRSIFQRRLAVGIQVTEAERSTQQTFKPRFDESHACRYPEEDRAQRSEAPLAEDGNEAELRSLWVSNSLSYWLRPLVPLGLLAALAVAWLYLYLGWEMRSPLLAPGNSYRLPSREVVVAYSVEPDLNGQDAKENLVVQIGSQVFTGTVEGSVRARLGPSMISSRSGDLVLLIRDVDGAAVLAEPGQPDRTESVGVILPGPGSEESILLPGISSGLRIVRRTDEPDAFFVELYQGAEVQPRQRIEVSGPTMATISTNDEMLALQLIPVRGINVTIRHIPGTWILWISLALCAVGFYGIIQPPSIAMTQIEPWIDNGALVTMRSSEAADREALVSALQDQIQQPER